MSFIRYLDDVARRFIDVIESQPGTTRIPTKDYGWENHRFANPRFRFAHVEIFNQDRFMVLHCCVFPRADDPSPIFGFDVIAGDSKVTGLFMDLSPTTHARWTPMPFIPVAHPRDVPEWGRIFSDGLLACRPDGEELSLICGEAVDLLSEYLGRLGTESSGSGMIAGMQDRYCLQQRRNEHTTRAIRNLLGEELAKEFIEDVLFPTIRPTSAVKGMDTRYPALMSRHDVAALAALAAAVPHGGIVVECGSALGGSAKVMLDANPHLSALHLVDIDWMNDGDPLDHEIDLYHEHVMGFHDGFPLRNFTSSYDFASWYLSSYDNVVVHRCSAPYDLGWWTGEVDMVFEDSSHMNPQLMDNMEFWWKHLRSGGIMSGHDYGVGCKDVDATVTGLAEKWGVELNHSSAVWWLSKP
jgi:phycocyanobilin:ferredoxin oxidoreductase